MRTKHVLISLLALTLAASTVACSSQVNVETTNPQETEAARPQKEFPEIEVKTTDKSQKILENLDIMTINEVLAEVSVIDLAAFEASDYESVTSNETTASGLSATVEYEKYEFFSELAIQTDRFTVNFHHLNQEEVYGAKELSFILDSLTDEAPFRERAYISFRGDYAEVEWAYYMDGDSYCNYQKTGYDDEEEYVKVLACKNSEASTELISALTNDSSISEIALQMDNAIQCGYDDDGEWYIKGTVRALFDNEKAADTFVQNNKSANIQVDEFEPDTVIMMEVTLPAYGDVIFDGDGLQSFITIYHEEYYYRKINFDETGKVYELSDTTKIRVNY